MKKILLLLLLTVGSVTHFYSAQAEEEVVEVAENPNPTPLMTACDDGDLTEVKRLINAGETVDAQDNYGETALYYACESDEDNAAKIVEFLLRAYPKIN